MDCLSTDFEFDDMIVSMISQGINRSTLNTQTPLILDSQINAVFIIDEALTSRLAAGGLQSLVGLKPDLTTLGKYLGGTLAFGALDGRRDIMAFLTLGLPTHFRTPAPSTTIPSQCALAILDSSMSTRRMWLRSSTIVVKRFWQSCKRFPRAHSCASQAVVFRSADTLWPMVPRKSILSRI
jgi:hypothetical protein